MARPLPKTNAPASAKKRSILISVPPDATPCSPVTKTFAQGANDRAAVALLRRGGAFTIKATAPLRRKTQTTSRAVHAVTRVFKAKRLQRSQSFASVIRTSFTALRATMAITAAPMP